MLDCLKYINKLPLELAINVCNECLSLCSDQALNIQFKTSFPSVFFLPFLYKVRVGVYYIECINKTGSILKIYYSEENFLKFIQLLQEGYKIGNLEIKSDMHSEFAFMKVLVNSTKKIKLDFFPYLYLYFFKEHPLALNKIYEFNVDNFDLFEIMHMLVEENFKFPNLKRISIKLSCMGSVGPLNYLMMNISNNCFESQYQINIVHYIEISDIKDIIRYTTYRIKMDAMINEFVSYKSKISLVVNNIDILVTLNESRYINYPDIYKLSIGTLSKTASHLIEEQIQFMLKLKEITTYSKMNLQQYISQGILKHLQIYKDFSISNSLPLGIINTENLPRLSCLSINVKGLKHDAKFQIPQTLSSLHITNYGRSHSADFSSIDFSQCNLKTLYICIEGHHETIAFLNMPPTLSSLVISNTENPKVNVEHIIINTDNHLSCLRTSFPKFSFIQLAIK